MSNPMRDYHAKRGKESRRSTSEKYTPVVLWVKTPHVESPEGLITPEERVRRHIRDTIEIPFVDVKTDHEPYLAVVTEFDDEWEDVRGDSDE